MYVTIIDPDLQQSRVDEGSGCLDPYLATCLKLLICDIYVIKTQLYNISPTSYCTVRY